MQPAAWHLKAQSIRRAIGLATIREDRLVSMRDGNISTLLVTLSGARTVVVDVDVPATGSVLCEVSRLLCWMLVFNHTTGLCRYKTMRSCRLSRGLPPIVIQSGM